MKENLTKHVQKGVLYLLITDTEFCKIASSHIDTSIFTSEPCRVISSICINYFNEYGEASQDHFNDIFFDEVNNMETSKKEVFIEYVKALDKVKPNKTYIINKLNNLLKHMKFEKGVLDFADLVTEGEYTKAENYMYDLLETNIAETDNVEFYLKEKDSVLNRETKEEYDMITDISGLNHMIGGFKRGQLITFVAGYKAGKTFCLQEMAKSALRQGMKVLFLSHEVDKETLYKRWDMMLSKTSTSHIGQIDEVPYYNKETDSLETIEITRESIYNPTKILKARKALSRCGGSMVVKKYPMSTCKISEVERYLSYLENFHSWTPDLIITDYLDIMDLSDLGSDDRDRLNKGYMKLKSIADSRNCIVMTVSQVVAAVLEKEKVTMADLSNDKRKSGNADIVIAFSSTPEKSQQYLGRISVLASRNSEDGVYCYYSNHLPTGQFCVSSWFGDDLGDDFMENFSQDFSSDLLGDD